MSDPTLPTVSVVIPTYQRRDNLPAVLEHLLTDPALHEAIVVVDGCDDGSLELLESLAERHPRLRPVWTPNRGGADARRLGVEMSTGEVVLLLDDDVVAAPGLVTGHARHHSTGDDLVVLGFMPTRLPQPGAKGRFATEFYAQEYLSVCASYEEDPDNILLRLWGGNVSLRRESLLRVPHETGRFAAANHSDRDFGIRCRKAGLRGVFDRSLLSSHEHVRPMQAFLRDARKQGAGRALVHAAHEDVIGPLQMSETLLGLPAPLRAVVRLDRFGPVRAVMTGVLHAVARLAAAAGLTPVEVLSAKLLRRLATRAGIREATAELAGTPAARPGTRQRAGDPAA